MIMIKYRLDSKLIPENFGRSMKWKSGVEPDVAGYDDKTGEYIFL